MDECFEVGDRVVWVHDVPGCGYRPRRTVRTPGTVTGLDLPRLGRGVRVEFDEPDPDTGAPGCYAAYREVEGAPGGQR
jgi:hypothetical protein